MKYAARSLLTNSARGGYDKKGGGVRERRLRNHGTAKLINNSNEKKQQYNKLPFYKYQASKELELETHKFRNL